MFKIVLFFAFLRPFICEQAFPDLGLLYLFLLFLLILSFLIAKKRLKLINPLDFFVLFFLGVVVISTFFPNFNLFGIFELFFFSVNIGAYLCCRILNYRETKTFIRLSVLAAGLVSAYGLYSYFFGFAHLESYLKINPQEAGGQVDYILSVVRNKRIFSTFISCNVLSSYLLLSSFWAGGLILSGFLEGESKECRWDIIFSVTCLVLIVTALTLTKTISAILLFLVMFPLFIFLAFKSYRYFKGSKLELKKFFLPTAASLIIISVIMFYFNRVRLVSLFDYTLQDNSFMQRINYWVSSLRIFWDFPLLGIGWRKFGLYYCKYLSLGANVSHYSHNIILQIMAETGILGLTGLAGLVFSAIKLGLKELKSNNINVGLKLGLFFSVAAFLLHNLVDIGFYFGQASFFFWAGIGLLVNQNNKK